MVTREHEQGPKTDSSLRTIEAQHVTDYLEKHWGNIEIDILPRGESKEVEKGSSGEGLKYEARVDFGDLLTTPIAGTNLPAEALTEWLDYKGFVFEHGSRWLKKNEAAQILASDEQSVADIPVFRAWRREGGIPVEIEYYNGSWSPKMQELTRLGNLPSVSQEERELYSKKAGESVNPFISKGTTKVAQHLALSPGYRRVAYKDDCIAAASSIVADMLIRNIIDMQEKRVEPLFITADVVIATTQSIPVLMYVAERLHAPLLIRAGAPSFGLDGTEENLNYMRNTQPEMTRFGPLTSGDFGNLLIGTGEAPKDPATILYGHGSPLRETVFFLRGGGPIMDLMFMSLDQREKRHQGVISIRTAKRIHRGFHEWSVIETGIHQVPEDDFNPIYHIPKGATLQWGKLNDSPIQIFEKGQYGKLVGIEDTYRVIKTIINGQTCTLYEPIPDQNP